MIHVNKWTDTILAVSRSHTTIAHEIVMLSSNSADAVPITLKLCNHNSGASECDQSTDLERCGCVWFNKKKIAGRGRHGKILHLESWN